MVLPSYMEAGIICLMVAVVTSSNIGNDRQDIGLSADGGYTDILIAIDERVPEDLEIISKLQEYFTKASALLLTATKNRLYFKNFTIVVPDNWTYQSSWLEAEERESVKKARIVIAEANAAYGDEPYTRQPGSCGQEGDFVHFTSRYLTQLSTDDPKYRPSKRIVKEFAKLKWGLFDENIPVNDTTASKFYTKSNALYIQGCIEGITYSFKDLSQCELGNDPPPPPCDFNLGVVLGSASLLSYEYSDSVTGFCTDNEVGATHNKISGNLQNDNCEDRSAWSVMMELEDFATDYGLTRGSDNPPDPEFRIVQRQVLVSSTSTTSTTTTATTTTPITTTPTSTTSTSTTTTPITTTPTSTTSTTTTTTTTTPVTTTPTSTSSTTATATTTTPITTTPTSTSSTTATTTTTTPITTTQASTSPTTTTTSTTAIPPMTAPATLTSCPQDIVCLCLDVSGSMNRNDRIKIMSEAVQLYILSLKFGTAVGVVSFSDDAYLHAVMTDVTNDSVKESLKSTVPTETVGGTDIASGIYECQKILSDYTGGDISNTRILLHSDGDGFVGNSIATIINEGVILDTVLFGQGGYLADQASQTGGKEFFASDDRGQLGLLAFYEETSSTLCEADSTDALLNNDIIIIIAGEATYQGRVYFDITIGLNTKMIFKYNVEVEITISTALEVTYSKDTTLLTTIAVIEGQLEQYVDYTITKADPSVEASAILTVTSSPIPGVLPIEVSDRVNSDNIMFSASTELIGYIGVFQGYSPVLQLTVRNILEDPAGGLTPIEYYDDGTGKDSVPNDGIYTGFLPPHLIGGDGVGTFYGLSIDISGEGVLPEQGGTGSRRKRCTSCNSLGNVTRSGSGGVIVINNWVSVPDTTPPERISDLRVLDASEETGLITLGWTAPGEDLNIGKASGYEFRMGANASVDDMINFEPDATLNNVTALLEEAGTALQLIVDTNTIMPEMFGLPESADISTYYFSLRAYDSANNSANWSSIASASFVDVAALIASMGLSTTSSTMESPTQISPVIPPVTIIGISVGVIMFAVLVVGLGMCAYGFQSKKNFKERQSEFHVYEPTEGPYLRFGPGNQAYVRPFRAGPHDRRVQSQAIRNPVYYEY